MSEQQIKAKFDAIREKLTVIEAEIAACRKILKGESP
jgi:hypothetical protein